jgi:mxaC protein
MLFNHPLVLWLLPLALLPILLERTNSKSYSWVDILPNDPLSNIVGILLKALATIALASIIIGLAGPHSLEEKVERLGVGAQIGMVLDRSASMDDPFAGGHLDGRVGETKSVAASRLMVQFVLARENDMIGLITFSNSAMYVLPLTESREAVLAAIRATAGNSLFQTNIGGGLTSAVGLFKDVPDSGSRAIILLSDGAGRVGSDVQQKLRDWLQRYNISLYWIILKKPNSRSVLDEYIRPDDEALPAEIELYNYFKSLRTPFEVYEAENPKALASAIADINQKEKKPIKYFEKIPGRDFTSLCYALAILMIVLLLGVKYLEVRTWRSA